MGKSLIIKNANFKNSINTLSLNDFNITYWNKNQYAHLWCFDNFYSGLLTINNLIDIGADSTYVDKKHYNGITLYTPKNNSKNYFGSFIATRGAFFNYNIIKLPFDENILLEESPSDFITYINNNTYDHFGSNNNKVDFYHELTIPAGYALLFGPTTSTLNFNV